MKWLKEIINSLLTYCSSWQIILSDMIKIIELLIFFCFFNWLYYHQNEYRNDIISYNIWIWSHIINQTWHTDMTDFFIKYCENTFKLDDMNYNFWHDEALVQILSIKIKNILNNREIECSDLTDDDIKYER